ncbi:MAG: ABC transporter [Bacillota bacterium]|nr:MAG: ABC transporter [Bacillota bacterium]
MEKNAAKPQKYKRSDNVIPDFEYLFDEDEKPKPKPAGKKKNTGVGMRFYKRLFKNNIGGFLVSLLMFILKNSPVWIMPIITANIINVVTNDVAQADAIRTILINSIVLAVILLQNIPTHVIYSRITDKMLRRTGAGLRSAVVRKLQHLSITYHKEIETGKIQSKFLKDIESVEGLNTNIIKILIPNIISALVSIGIAVYNSGIVTLFFLVIIPANIFIAQGFRKVLRKKNHMYRVENESVSAKLSNMLEMLTVTKAHGLEDEEIAQFEKNIRYLTTRGLDVDKSNAYFGSASWVIASIMSGACLIFCAILALNGIIQAGDVVLYQSLFAAINGSVQVIINVLPTFSTGFEAVNSISEIMMSKDVEDDRGKEHVDSVTGNVTFDHVYYRYPNGAQYVVDDLNLDVKAGECIAVVGASGSGKSTIMNMIIGFLQPTEGRLLIDDKDITQISLTDYRHCISVVPQNSILFSGTIRENITYGMENISEERIQEVAEMANLNEFVKDLPNGLDTFIGEHGGKLSGGQKQRITIARALIRNPKILILDEATSALDNISEYHVQKAISGMIKGRTTFIVAHRLSTIRDADRIVVMEAGKCVEMGTYEELIEKKGKFFELKNLNDMSYKQAEAGLN